MSNMRKSTTIIIPCYEQEVFLYEAVESSLQQTVKCDIIIVDDGSKYPVENLWEDKSNVKLIRQKNKGLSGARNTGIRNAKTEYVLPLDADDIIDKRYIEETLGVGDIVTVQQQEFGDSNTLWAPQDNFTLKDFKTANRANCCSLYKKSMWEEIGGYDENMKEGYEDWDFWIRAVKAGYKFKVIHKPLFFYRKHGRSMVDAANEKHDKILKYIINKNYATIQ